MKDKRPDILDLFHDIEQIVDKIPSDFGGGSPLSKIITMANIALKYNLKNYVEIGVYRGRSFFPLAYISKLLGGMAFGIDAYDYETAKEVDLDGELGKKVDEFLSSLNFSQMYENVKNLRMQLDLNENSEIINSNSNLAAGYIKKNKFIIDMLHIDGNHDTKAVLKDVENYLPLMSKDGFIVFDDINWNSVNVVYKQIAEKYEEIFNDGYYAILYVGGNSKKITDIDKFNFKFLHDLIESKITHLQISTAQIAEIERLKKEYSIQLDENERIRKIYATQVAENERLQQDKSTLVDECEGIRHNYANQVAENKQLRIVNTAQKSDIQHLQQENTNQIAEIMRLQQGQTVLITEEENKIKSLEFVIDSIYHSTSWKITRPIREVKTFTQKVFASFHAVLWKICKLIYNKIPISLRKKKQIKEKLFDFLSQADLPISSTVNLSSQEIQLDTTPYKIPSDENKKPYSFHNIRVVDRKLISVVVTSYNHEQYITQCIDSILNQHGDFNLEIILGDDDSTDNSRNILSNYTEEYPGILKLLPKQKNLGVTKNLKRCLDACTGDYIAICEGDDYWTDENKLQKQMDLLEVHKDYSMCFSAFNFFFEDENRFSPFINQIDLNKSEVTTEDLIQNNCIGNFSCCMYRTSVVKNFPQKIFDVYTVDWMFNMACGDVGKIGYIPECMSVYRKHVHGAWTGKSDNEQIQGAKKLIDTYDYLLGNRYHDLFMKQKAKLNQLASFYKDILILDTVFPHPLSPFRYQEFITYLDNYPNSLVLTTGEHLPALQEKRSVGEVILEFEREHPEYKAKTVITSHDIDPYHAKIAYLMFLYNMKVFLPTLEKNHIPFVFTLYPGGGFEVNKSESDDALRKIFNSPQFRKVIVTQKITYDYLINKNFCSPEKIEFIFGVVSPLGLIKPYFGKKYFGFDKDKLDICFVSHKYMPKGIDKGYDVFIDVAKKLVKIHSNIHFHVVGSFTKEDISVAELKEKITFYGLQKNDWFESFYLDKDIILSPNVPFILAEGAFDGFPTASCVEAGLRNVALFCTDILQLNEKFSDRDDIIIIPHESEEIVKIINEYYSNPGKLKQVAQNGSAKIRELYGYDSQLAPRIKILDAVLDEINLTHKNG